MYLVALSCENRAFKSFVDRELIDILNMKLASAAIERRLVENKTGACSKKQNRKLKVDWRVPVSVFLYLHQEKIIKIYIAI